MRVGTGYDAHAFADGRALVLGGVTIPGARGLEGHSDADVLCHAIADALLGAAALGDIGSHFPSEDPRWRDRPSTAFLADIHDLLYQAHFRVSSVDATLIIQEPRIAPYREAMREQVAAALQVAPGVVSIKASTTDGLGFIGRGEGAAAHAVAVIEHLR